MRRLSDFLLGALATILIVGPAANWVSELYKDAQIFAWAPGWLRDVWKSIVAFGGMPWVLPLGTFLGGVLIGGYIPSTLQHFLGQPWDRVRDWHDLDDAISIFGDQAERLRLQQAHAIAAANREAFEQGLTKGPGGLITDFGALLSDAGQKTNRDLQMSSLAMQNYLNETLEALRQRLRREELVAKGFNGRPDRIDETPVNIPAEHWALLKIGPDNRARGDLLDYFAVQIGEPRSSLF